MQVEAIRVDRWTDGTREMYAEYQVGRPSQQVTVRHKSVTYEEVDVNVLVTHIKYHVPEASDSVHYADVTFSNGVCVRCFDVDAVIWNETSEGN